VSGSSWQKQDQLLVQRGVIIAAAAPGEMHEIPFKVSTAERTDSNGHPQVRVDLLIDSAAVDLSTVENTRACKLIAAIFYADENGTLLGSNWWLIENSLNAESYGWTQKTGIPFSTTVPLKTQSQILKIVVYDERSDKVGTKYMQLNNTTLQEPGH
jgi:hypothetical protein